MESVNKKRLLFWSIVFLIMLLFSYIGIKKYEEGYGTTGKIRQKLLPISDNFNKLDYIIRIGDVNASVTRDTMTIEYKLTDKTEKAKCKYKNENNLEILSCKYKNSSISSLISRALIDSVERTNGNYNSVFDTYELSEFTKLNISQGINYVPGEEYLLEINIKNDLYHKISQYNLNKIELPYILDSDLETFDKDLIEKSNYTITKNTKTIYLVKTDTSYEIYAQDTNNNDKENFKTSILNVISKIDLQIYEDLKDNTFDKDEETARYKMTINYDDTDNILNGIFKSKNNIIKIEIY